MGEYPLLSFLGPELAQLRRRRGGGASNLRLPSARRQGERLNPEFQRLGEAIRARNIELRDNAVGVLPDQVLVLETVGTVDNFLAAVKGISGLEWLAETDLSDVEPDEDFHDERGDRSLSGRLFLVMTDVAALNTLRIRFEVFQSDQDARFPRGLAPLKRVFQQLRAMRFWGPQDRLAAFRLIENWRFRLEYSDDGDFLPFEAELWFRDTSLLRQQAESRFRAVVDSLGGEISRTSMITEISYHGVLGRIPAQSVSELVEQDDSQLVMCEDVMFLRPVGQCSVPATDDLADLDIVGVPALGPKKLGEPVVALFDGLPLTGHTLLDGRLVVDDPDGYEDYYQANQRRHGTGMASLICHGELDDGLAPIGRRLYVRPILRPVVEGLDEVWPEKISDDELPVDLIHRAVRRLFEGEGDEPAVAPSVRVINLSVCDGRRPFVREMSPLARLLDWLSFKYQVLFVVSAGNHPDDIELDVSLDELNTLGNEDRESAVFNALVVDTRNRSLLSPAETLNGLTIGAVHSDSSEIPDGYRLVNPFYGHGFPSVLSAHGPGYRRSVKPDILLPGGRQSLVVRLGPGEANAKLEITDYTAAPGQKVAWPGEQGSVSACRYTRGTSNATALASRAACQLYDVLQDLRSEFGSFPDEAFDTALLKTLLVHGAHCELPLKHYSSILNSDNGTRQDKEVASRLVGYGPAHTDRVMLCTDHRVTVLGCGEISVEEAHVFRFPVPVSLSGVAEPRRMITTLAWLSPINCAHRGYRRAHLEFSADRFLAENPVGVTRFQAGRGTVQHEVREGRSATVVNDGDEIEIRVECRAGAGTFDDSVRYGLAVTLEVAENIDVVLYEEIRDRLQPPTPVLVNT